MDKIFGDLQGLKSSHLAALARLYRRRVPAQQILTREVAETMGAIAQEIRRDVAVLLNRRGQVVGVSVGDAARAHVPESAIHAARLSGLRLIHTHSRGGGLSRADLATLAKYRLDVIAAIELDDGRPTQVWVAHLAPGKSQEPWVIRDPQPLHQVLFEDFKTLTRDLEKALSAVNVHTIQAPERAFVVMVTPPDTPRHDVTASLTELRLLLDTLDYQVVGATVQKRETPDAATLVGRGKVEDLALACREKGANVVVFHDDLSPSQQSNLEQALRIRVMDRTQLILDIFAQRAQSREGKLQVELARLHYLLPRLSGHGQGMSRLGGGIGTRGPGETKLEVDRRRVRARIAQLEKEVDELTRQRAGQRRGRQAGGLPTAVLVGYTNAGKSSLLNALTGAGVLAENKPFATLDPRTRRLLLPNGQAILMTDTVGIIRRLPDSLRAAFRATLEEVREADLVIHVVDAASPEIEEHVAALEDLLFELGAENKPTITVLNKSDLVQDRRRLMETVGHLPHPVYVSANTGDGLLAFSSLLGGLLRAPQKA